MRYSTESKKRFAAFSPLFAAALAVVGFYIGCAEIPTDKRPDPVDEYVPVSVDVVGGDAAVYPSRSFEIPVDDAVMISVDVRGEVNTRIAAISVGGTEVCCRGDEVVRDTSVIVVGAAGGVAVVVELAKIDGVMPKAEIVSPALTTPGEPVASISVCSMGELEYRLNKRMASGYIKWRNMSVGAENNDSLQTVRIPEDITAESHNIGDWSYADPDGYLGDGPQRFDLAVSPVDGKRVTREQFTVPATYSFEIQFTDSLGNRSEKAYRAVWVTSAAKGCQ